MVNSPTLVFPISGLVFIGFAKLQYEKNYLNEFILKYRVQNCN